jgi:hypothetical protein
MKRTTLLQGTATALGTLVACLALGSVWRLDAQAQPATFQTADELNRALRSVQHAQQEYERAKREAFDRCRAERGPDALVWETPEGHIVCRRRKTTGGPV